MGIKPEPRHKPPTKAENRLFDRQHGYQQILNSGNSSVHQRVLTGGYKMPGSRKNKGGL